VSNGFIAYSDVVGDGQCDPRSVGKDPADLAALGEEKCMGKGYRISGMLIAAVFISGCVTVSDFTAGDRGMELYRKGGNVETRWAGFENPKALKAGGGITNKGAKGNAFDSGGGGNFTRLLDMDPVPELDDKNLPDGWTNHYRQDDYSAVALFYLDSPTDNLLPIADVGTRTEGID